MEGDANDSGRAKSEKNRCSEKNLTPLAVAIRMNNVKMVKSLLQNGADPNRSAGPNTTSPNQHSTSKLPTGMLTPLHRAVRKGSGDIVKILLKHKAVVDVKTDEGMTPLHFAILLGWDPIVKDLLDHGASVNSEGSSENSCSPLHLAIKRGYPKIVKLLLIHGANVYAKNNLEQTALEVALERRKVTIVAYLFTYLFDINEKSEHPSLFEAMNGYETEYTEMFKHMLDSPEVNLYNSEALFDSLFASAVELGHIRVVKHFLDCGVDINTHKAALKLAIMFKRAKVVAYVFTYLIDMDKKSEQVSLLEAMNGYEMEYTEMYKRVLKLPGVDFYNRRALLGLLFEAAVKMNYKPVVQHFVDYGVDIDPHDVLHAAAYVDENSPIAERQRAEIVQLLIHHGADVNARDKYGRTPIYYGILCKSTVITEILLSHGAGTIHDDHLLETAIENLDIPMFRMILQYDSAINVNSRNRFIKRSALRFCMSPEINREDITMTQLNARKEIFNILLEEGADVNARDIDGATPLHYVIREDFEEGVEILLKLKVDINAADNDGTTPLHLAAIKKKNDICKILCENKADVNVRNSIGRTPLHLALEKQRTSNVREILNSGANIHITDYDGNTSLHYAVLSGQKLFDGHRYYRHRSNPGPDLRYTDLPYGRCGDEDQIGIVSRLLELGVNVDSRNNGGMTPLHVAAQYGYVGVIDFLLHNHATLNAVDVHGNTALHLSAYNTNIKVCTTLLLKKVNIHTARTDGMTALHCACLAGNEMVAGALLESGAKIHARCKEGKTALHIAAENGYAEAIKILFMYGADINSKCKRGFTPFEYVKPCIFLWARDGTTVLRKHIAKLRIAGRYLCEQNLKVPVREFVPGVRLESFERACQEEICSMKKFTIIGQVTLYDILTRDMNTLTTYAQNQDIAQFMKKRSFRQKFPLYCDMLEIRFEEGTSRYILLNRSIDLFKLLVGCNVLYDIEINIFNYLSNTDLENLIEACLDSDIGYAK